MRNRLACRAFLALGLGLTSAAGLAQEPIFLAVPVANPAEREVAAYDDFLGFTEAAQSVDLKPRSTSFLVQVNVADGSLVKASEVLFQLDARPHQAALDQAQAEFEQARAQIQVATANMNRAKKLLEAKAISVEEVQLAEAERAKSEAGALAAQAKVNAAKLELESTRILAPFEGRVSRSRIAPGAVVTPETVLGTLVSTGSLNLRFAIDERTFLALETQARKGPNTVKVAAAFADEEGFPHSCQFESFDNQLDPQTGTLITRARLAQTGRNLLPGVSARVRMSGAPPYKALLVPQAVVWSDADGPFVIVVDDKETLAKRSVTVGPAVDGWRVIKTGLTAKDRVAQGDHAKKLGTKVVAKSVPFPEK